MKTSLRLVILMIFIIAVAAGVVQSRIERTGALEELRSRLRSLSLGLEESISTHIANGKTDRLARILKQVSSRGRGVHAIVCSRSRTVAFDSSASPWVGVCRDLQVSLAESAALSEPHEKIVGDLKNPYFLLVRRLESQSPSHVPYSLVLVESLESVERISRTAFMRGLLTAFLGGIVACAFVLFLSKLVMQRSLRYLVRWVRNIFRGEPISAPVREPDQRLPEEFRELTKELSSLALRMRQERLRLAWSAAAQQSGQWSKKIPSDPWADLRAKVNEVLKGRTLVIVANREPYLHQENDGKIEVVRPASGVVTALEPIMRLCGGGVWVGHGSANADRVVVDHNDEVRVPPENPTYTLRRVWLTEQEEQGYYYGFSNEGLWPLCHLAYTRPTFRLQDWEIYKSVNQKFADATLKRVNTARSVILVQDYHFAILPKLLREKAPEAAIELFWHIPWPNPEAFGICPQYKELLEGMLGADVVGFHTQFHCNNFLETCDRYLEARVDWERFSVTIGNHETLVRSYPISIATEPVRPLDKIRRQNLRQQYGITTEFVALGVDRLDYTKGLVERVAGVERFLEKYPDYVGRFSFVEMGTPSRTNIPSYKALISEVECAIDRVNQRFGGEAYRPIILLKGHFNWSEVADFYQLGQACLVTSLHDGMNLVAKEYVWSQNPDHGALILSRFTGAARELSEAFIVNPYSSEEIADALFESLTLSPEERRLRMLRMKERVRDHNAFHWATDLLAGVNAKA